MMSTRAQDAKLKIQTGHTSFVSAVRFTPSGQHIISGSIGGKINVWEASTGKEIQSVATNSYIYDLVLNQKGTVAFIADLYGRVTAWDLETSQQTSFPTLQFVPPAQLAFQVGPGQSQIFRPIAAHQNLLAVANQGDVAANILKLDKLKGVISIYDMNSGKNVANFKKSETSISSICFVDQSKVATTDYAYMALWDVAKGKEIYKIKHGLGKAFAIAANKNYVATGGASGYLYVWNVADGSKAFSLEGHQGDITNVSLSRDGKYCVSTDKYSTKIWDLKTGKEVYDNQVSNMVGQFSIPNNVCEISNDGRLMASSWFGTINTYDLQTQSYIQRLEGLDNGVMGVAFEAGTINPSMLYMGDNRVITKQWKYPTVESKTVGIEVSGKMVVADPTFKTLIAYFYGKASSIPVYSFDTGKELFRLEGHTDVIYYSCYSPDGKRIYTGSKDNSIRIWNAQTGELIDVLTRRGYASVGIDGNLYMSKNGKKLLVRNGAGTPAQVWDLDTKKPSFLSSAKFIHPPAFSPDGTMAAGVVMRVSKKGSISQLAVFDTSTGRPIGEFEDNPGSMYMCFSADSKSLAMTVADGIDVIDVASETLKYRLPHLQVNHYAFSDDYSQILTAGGDGFSRIWDYNSGKEIAAFSSYRDNENTIVLPSKYYFSTRGAVNGLHYVIDKKAVPFDQFDLQYNRPDLVFEALGLKDRALITSYNRAYKKRLAKNGVTEGMFVDEYHLPTVVIESAGIAATTTTKTLQLKIEASDDIYKVSKVIVSVNNVPIHGKSGLVVEEGKRYANTIEVELSSGRNKIGVYVVNEKGVKSIEQVLETKYVGPAQKPDLYVIAIGVSQFEDSDMNLTYAAKDARDFSIMMKTQEAQYGHIKVMEFVDENATKENILEVSNVLNASNVDDAVRIFVASHGLLDSNLDYFLATHDVDFYNPSVRGLNYDDLEGLLDGIPARKKIMFLDACHSGEVDKEAEGTAVMAKKTSGNVKFRGFKDLKKTSSSSASSAGSPGLQNSFLLMQTLFTDLRRGTGAVVISSAGGAEYAYESPEWNNGVFTYALIEGLQSGNCDTNQDGDIVVSEMRSYVMERVTTLTDGNQHPTSRNENLEFDFSVWQQ